MNIQIRQPANKGNLFVVCPACNYSCCRKHGHYTRKGFHGPCASGFPILIQRYRCLNPECPRCTFSILPPMVMRYCRFFWPCLLAIHHATAQKKSAYYQQYFWKVSSAVIMRARPLIVSITAWVSKTYQEVTGGAVATTLERMVKVIVHKLGSVEVTGRWFRHRYPLRFN